MRLPNEGNTRVVPANLRVPTLVGKGAGSFGRAREIAALLLWVCALFIALALGSYAGDPSNGDAGAGVTQPGPNWVGPVGEAIARALVTAIGVVSWTIPLELVL